VNRGSQCGSKVSWARSDVTQSFIEGELNHLLDVFAGSAKSVKDCLDVSAWLHGNYSQLILFVDPDQESLVIVVENASSVRPVSIKADCFKESVTLLEKEVIINKLLSLGFSQIV
jgi:16S rRNA G966 N2-methylase RsmD